MRNVYYPHDRVQFHPVGESRTKQSFQAECDINNILAKYAKTGLIDHVKKHGGYYGDLPLSNDFQTNLHAIMEAQASFDSLPANIRDRFQNDPARFLAFVEDPENGEEMVALGLRENSPSTASPEASTGAPVSSPAEGPPTAPAAPAAPS